MEICLSELITRATQCLVELGLSAGTIRDYQCSAFRPLESLLKDQENINPEILLAQEEFFLGQYQDGKISRHTFNWRIRGIRVLTEVCETETFTWKVFCKKEAVPLSEMFETALCGFISKQNCGQRQKNCRQSICRRFLRSLEDSGVTSFGDIRPCQELHREDFRDNNRVLNDYHFHEMGIHTKRSAQNRTRKYSFELMGPSSKTCHKGGFQAMPST